MPDRIEDFRVAKLQSFGANAWRMSHNPPNPELLNAADRRGLLVWDENRLFGDFATVIPPHTSLCSAALPNVSGGGCGMPAVVHGPGGHDQAGPEPSLHHLVVALQRVRLRALRSKRHP